MSKDYQLIVKLVLIIASIMLAAPAVMFVVVSYGRLTYRIFVELGFDEHMSGFAAYLCCCAAIIGAVTVTVSWWRS